MREIKQQFGNMVIYYPEIARAVGGVISAVMLQQLLYWWERKSGDLIYKTISELEQETALTRNNQETAIRKLTKLGLIKVIKKGTPQRRHFMVFPERIAEAVQKHKESGNPTNKNVENQQTSLPESDKLECGKAANKNVGNPQTEMLESGKLKSGKTTDKNVGIQQTNSENTTEITTENTTKITSKTTTEIFSLCENEFSPDDKKFEFDFFQKNDFNKIQDRKNNPPGCAPPPFLETGNSVKKSSVHLELKQRFDDFYQSATGLQYSWDSLQGMHLKNIRNKLIKLAKSKGVEDPENSENNVLADSFSMLLEAVRNNSWLMQRLSLRLIDSKFNELVLQINNSRYGKYSATQQSSIGFELQERLLAGIYGR